MKKILAVIFFNLILLLSGCTNLVKESDDKKPVIEGIDNTLTYHVGSLEPDWLVDITAKNGLGDTITNQITVDTSKVNMNKIGSYTITYSVSNKSGKVTKKDVTVEIKDMKAPSIKGFSDINIKVNSYTKPNWLDNISAEDDLDGNITHKIIIDDSKVDYTVPGIYDVYYNVSDISGNSTQAKIKLTVFNENDHSVTTPPKISVIEHLEDENVTIIRGIGYPINILTTEHADASAILIGSPIFDEEWLKTVYLNRINIAQSSELNIYKALNFDNLVGQIKEPNRFSSLNEIQDVADQHNLTKSQYLYLLNLNIKKYSLSLPDYTTHLSTYKDHLNPTFLNYLNKLSHNEITYEEFVRSYGTHIIASGIFGGKQEVYCANFSNQDEVQKPTSCFNIEKTITSSDLTSSPVIDHNTSSNLEEYISTIKIGGSILGDLQNMNHLDYLKWVDSLEDDGALIDYNEDGLIPIWEILPPAYEHLKDIMVAKYNEYAQNNTFPLTS